MRLKCYATVINRLHNVCIFRNHITQRTFSKSTNKFRSDIQNSVGPPWRVLFFGTDNFSVESLKSLHSELNTGLFVKCLEVVTSLKSPPNMVKQFALKNKLNLHAWPLENIALCGEFDIGIVVSFGHLMPKKIIEAFPLGMLNVHGSLLPRWRGAAPIVYAILSGDKETGISIMKIKPYKFDVGEVLKQVKCPIMPDDTGEQLSERLAVLGAELLLQCVKELPQCLEQALPQPDENTTYAPKVTDSLATVVWENMTSQEVYNLHRALCNVYPLTTRWHGKVVKLFGITLPSNDCENNIGAHKPGHVEYSYKTKLLRVWCGDGKYVQVSEVRVHNKKKMSAADFRNGFISKVADSECTFDSLSL